MFSMRFGEEVIRRSGILFEVGLVACEIIVKGSCLRGNQEALHVDFY